MTEQEATPPEPASVQVDEENDPFPPVVQETCPAGVEVEPVSTSVTVAVQVEAEPASTGVWQATPVDVFRAVPEIWVDPLPDV